MLPYTEWSPTFFSSWTQNTMQATWSQHARTTWHTTWESVTELHLEKIERSIGTSMTNTEADWCLDLNVPMQPLPVLTNRIQGRLLPNVVVMAPWIMSPVSLLSFGQMPVQPQDALAVPPGGTWQCCLESIDFIWWDWLLATPSHA